MNRKIFHLIFVLALIFAGFLVFVTLLVPVHNSHKHVSKQVKKVHHLKHKAKKKPVKRPWHPPHVIKSWTNRHKGKTFRVVQLPRCKHLETLITYNPYGETFKQAKRRTMGAAVMSGSFHNSQSYALADFLQRDGRVLSPAKTGRYFLAILPDGSIDLTNDYSKYKHKKATSAMAMGQRLVPLMRDGFSLTFMNEQTDRMAIAVNKNFIFIIQGHSDIWRLSDFIEKKLPVKIAVNSDGGHVIRGKAPIHVVFRWKLKGIAEELLK